MSRMRWLFMLALVALSGSAEAQRPHGEKQRGDRGALERRFRERLGAVMRERLGLNEDQLRRLGEVNERFESRRRELFQSEREIRIGMRRALGNDSSATNEEVARLMDRAIQLQRQRIDLLEAEQRELAQFLTPIQRARYFGVQEQLRRQMEEMRDRRRPPGALDSGVSPEIRRRSMRPPGG
ncbi:MAG: hypothetical protein ACT4P7_21000 [Gemmatimonadaceae bacterium]